MSAENYDPLDYANIAKSVVDALLRQPLSGLPPGDRFEGPGVYAIYYSGDFEAYRRIAESGNEIPIYVGSAQPPGGRKGGDITSKAVGYSLYGRLVEHSKSIEAVLNLKLSDFRCRYLVVLPVWIPLAERFLIERYKPFWNLYIDGFGNHDPGKGRYAGACPAWDILHPGRAWACRLGTKQTREEIVEELRRRTENP